MHVEIRNTLECEQDRQIYYLPHTLTHIHSQARVLCSYVRLGCMYTQCPLKLSNTVYDVSRDKERDLFENDSQSSLA